MGATCVSDSSQEQTQHAQMIRWTNVHFNENHTHVYGDKHVKVHNGDKISVTSQQNYN